MDFIKQYKGPSKIVVSTMNSRLNTLTILQFLGITDKVNCYICLDDVEFQKPNPEAYSKASQKIGVDPSDCAVIEDTIVGARAGIDAKMECYVFLNSYNNKKQFTDYAIKGFIKTKHDLEEIAYS